MSIEQLEYKTQVVKQLDAFLNGGSTTANKKNLNENQHKALSYLKGQGICLLDKPSKKTAGYDTLDENDKAGRYRLIPEQEFVAQRLRGIFKTEIKALLKQKKALRS
jgi:hypothetical protein